MSIHRCSDRAKVDTFALDAQKPNPTDYPTLRLAVSSMKLVTAWHSACKDICARHSAA